MTTKNPKNRYIRKEKANVYEQVHILVNHICLDCLSLALQNGCISAPRGRSTPELQIVLLHIKAALIQGGPKFRNIAY